MESNTEQIKDKLNIAEVVAEYVTLKQVGQHFKGLCPFHQEKTPSFLVSPDKGIWHCFGCNEGGDVFTFIQKIEGLDFPATLKLLADRAGVQLKAYTPDAAPQGRTRLFDILWLTARVYHDILLNQKTGEKAKKYLVERGVAPETLETFLVGYAPHAWQTLHRYLQKKGFTDNEMVDAGIVARNQQGKMYDRFRGRIMFPIHDVQGRVVAFGGRIVPWHATGEEGKYVNSPETSVYEKRNTVYNLNRAKQAIRAVGHAVVVEGYMDAVLLSQNDIPHVVASSGTAFTTEQIKQLQRFTNELHFAFDGDAAGLNAAIAATAAASSAGLRVGTIFFPDDQDPADMAQTNPKQLKELLAAPQTLVAVLLKELKAMPGGNNREELLEKILPLVKQVSNPVQQGEMIQEIAADLHLPETTIFEQLRRTQLPVAPVAAPADESTTTTSLPGTLEHHLVGLLVLEPSVRSQLWPMLNSEHFTDTSLKPIINHLQELAAADAEFLSWPADKVLQKLPQAYIPLAEACRQICEIDRHTSSLSAEQTGRSLWQLLTRRYLEQELKVLQQQLGSTPLDEKTKVLEKFQAVAAQLAQLQV